MAVTINKDNSKHTLLANEQGVALITSLLILMLLTFIGITSTMSTITEKAIIRSDAIFEQNFYLAESAAMEGVQRLENESSPDELLAPLINKTTSNNKDLLIEADPEEPRNDLANLDANDDKNIDHDDTFDLSEIDPSDTYRLVVQMPISSGSSLGLGSSRIYSYTSYGFTEAQGARSLVKVGYKKRF